MLSAGSAHRVGGAQSRSPRLVSLPEAQTPVGKRRHKLTISRQGREDAEMQGDPQNTQNYLLGGGALVRQASPTR